MLDVAYGPILAEKSLKNPFFGKIHKKRKTPPQKKLFIFLPNQVGFSIICNTLNTVVKEFFTWKLCIVRKLCLTFCISRTLEQKQKHFSRNNVLFCLFFIQLFFLYNDAMRYLGVSSYFDSPFD
jgi:hypothetical protein